MVIVITKKVKYVFILTAFILMIITTSTYYFRSNFKVQSDKYNSYPEEINLSQLSSKIYINGSSDWFDFKNEGNCTGLGTYSDPYVIANRTIYGYTSGSCIWIENSDVYFKIENCTGLYAGDCGIYLYNVSNGLLINNTFSLNFGEGIKLDNCHNNTIANTTSYYNYDGVRLYESYNNTISENHISDNYFIGIGISYSWNTTIINNTIESSNIGIDLYKSNQSIISGNTMNNCGLIASGTIEMLSSNDIDTTNTVNEKILYYYSDKVGLASNNFTNAGQVILINCNNSLITNLDISHSSCGISLYYCNMNFISGNTANGNRNGITLDYCYNNTISGNTANDNYWNGIDLSYSNYNNLTGNTGYRNDVGISVWNSNFTTISKNYASNNIFYGIWLDASNNNTISGNSINDNLIGILLDKSNNNVILGNSLSGNDECITEIDCEGNLLSNNDCHEGLVINGYNLLFILGIFCLLSLAFIFRSISKIKE